MRRRAPSRTLCARPALVLAAALLASCGGPDPDKPPEIAYGADLCAKCGMIISDDRFAAASMVEDDGRRAWRLFDDVGEMIEWLAASDPGAVTRSLVKDAETRAWIDAQSAWYAYAESMYTPMATGVAAFASRASAARAAQENQGVVRAYAEVAR